VQNAAWHLMLLAANPTSHSSSRELQLVQGQGAPWPSPVLGGGQSRPRLLLPQLVRSTPQDMLSKQTVCSILPCVAGEMGGIHENVRRIHNFERP
jgi:hypothetical protein